jgi:hypothetical protein
MMPRVVLVILLALQAALAMWTAAAGHAANGDEPYFIAKARYLSEHHAFAHASAADLEIERGTRWGISDWRPPGYPAFVALCAMGRFDVAAVRMRVTAAQFIVLAAALFLGFLTIEPVLPGLRAITAAALFGLAPWPFEFVTSINTDSLTMSLTFIGALVLWRARSAAAAFLGALALMATMLLRPESAALAPLIIAVAVVLKRGARWLPAVAAIVLVFGLQLGYRRHFTGAWSPSLFGGLHVRDQGAFDWAHTWYGTEAETYDFVYGLTNGDLRRELPPRAFADDAERRAVEAAISSVQRNGYSPAVDDAFRRLAEKRKREHPLAANAGPRLWHAAHLWINVETNSQLLRLLAPVPRALRRVLLGSLLALKLALYALFVAALVRLPRFPAELRGLVLVMAAIVVTRTLLVGVILNWLTHRYALPCWPPLMECAMAAMATVRRAG